MIKIDAGAGIVQLKNTITSLKVIKEKPTGAMKVALSDDDGVMYTLWVSAALIQELRRTLPSPKGTALMPEVPSPFHSVVRDEHGNIIGAQG